MLTTKESCAGQGLKKTTGEHAAGLIPILFNRKRGANRQKVLPVFFETISLPPGQSQARNLREGWDWRQYV